MPLIKADLISQLENSKNNLMFGLGSVSVLSDNRGIEILKTHRVEFGEHVVNFAQLAELLANSGDHKVVVTEFIKMLFRTAISESFELVKSYTKETSQEKIFKKFECYNLVRQLRNAVAHNFHWDLKHQDKNFYSELPITWKDITLTALHHGQPVELSHISWWTMLELVLELNEKAKQELN